MCAFVIVGIPVALGELQVNSFASKTNHRLIPSSASHNSASPAREACGILPTMATASEQELWVSVYELEFWQYG